MSHSMYNADRTTHLKIVVVALTAAIGVAIGGISMRMNAEDFSMAQKAPMIDAGGQVQITTIDNRVIR